MRNTLLYPITNEEIIQTLRRMGEDFAKDIANGPVGSIDGMILDEIEQRLSLTIHYLTTIDNYETLIHLLKELHNVKS